MSKGKAPEAPDYKGAAIEQGKLNKEAAQYEAGVNRPTEIDPYGQRTWRLKEGADPNNPKPGDWVVETSLAAPQQQLLDLENQNSLAYGQTAQDAITRVRSQMGEDFDTSQLAAKSGIQLPSSTEEFNADRARLEKAIYDSQASRLDPRFEAQQQSLAAQMAAQGLDSGNRAYRLNQDALGRERTDAYGQAQRDAIMGGEQMQSSRIANMLSLISGQRQERQADFEEQAYLRQLPLNEANALRTGAQVSNPNFQAWNQASGYQAAPIYQATGDGFNSALNRFNAKEAQRNNTLNFVSKMTESGVRAATGGM